MPSITGGDQLGEDYAPHLYVAGVFVGDRAIDFEHWGKRYKFAKLGDRVLIEQNGKPIDVEQAPEPIQRASRVNLHPAAEAFIQSSPESVRRELFQTVYDLNATWYHGTYEIKYVGNYGIAFTVVELEELAPESNRGKAWAKYDIHVTSVFHEQRAHVVVRQTGEYSDASTIPMKVFLTPEAAQAHIEFLVQRWQVRKGLREQVQEVEKNYKEVHPQPERPALPVKPKMKPNQTQKQHIEENLEPWKAETHRLVTAYEEENGRWFEGWTAHRKAWIEANIAETMKKWDLKDSSIESGYSSSSYTTVEEYRGELSVWNLPLGQ